MGDNTSWADLNRDGRRLEKLIKMCEGMVETEAKKVPPEDNRIWGYMDRISRFTTNKKEIADMVLGINKILRKSRKTVVA